MPFDDLVRHTNPRLGEAPAGARDAEPAGSVQCSNCGHTREAQFRFCPVCGAPGT